MPHLLSVLRVERLLVKHLNLNLEGGVQSETIKCKLNISGQLCSPKINVLHSDWVQTLCAPNLENLKMSFL